MRRLSECTVSFVFLVFIFVPCVLSKAPAPPEQPLTGPGGYSYEHGSMISNGPFWADGPFEKDNYKYYIYEPSDPKPTEAPVALFLHGWLAYDPNIYLGWIEHIVKKGYVVVWAQYDAGLTFPRWFLHKTMVTWLDALQFLETERGHVRAEKDEFGRIKTAIMGHSTGGSLSAMLAARAADSASVIPVPYAVVSVEPGWVGKMPDENFAEIDSDTKLILVVGEDDIIVRDSTAVAIWNDTPQISDVNRDFLLVQSDRYGWPRQIADHKFPTTGGFRAKVDARDFYVTYKLSVAALNCAFRGTDCECALGDGSFEQVDMGQWSDGQPMKPMVWLEDPNLLETTCEDPGLTRSQRRLR